MPASSPIPFSRDDCEDLMFQLKHLIKDKDPRRRQSEPTPRIVASGSGTCLNQCAVLLIEDSDLHARRRSLSMQGRVNAKFNKNSAPEPAKRIIASPSGHCLDQADVLLIEGGDSKRRRSLSAIKKRDSIINRDARVASDGELPAQMIGSPNGEVLKQDEVKLLMSPSSIADHKHFDGPVPPFVL